MLWLVTYDQRDIPHARTVEACCEAAAGAAAQRHAQWDASWRVRPVGEDAQVDIIGGGALCPLQGNHTETETET